MKFRIFNIFFLGSLALSCLFSFQNCKSNHENDTQNAADSTALTIGCDSAAFKVKIDEKQVSLFTIGNSKGMVAQITNYGARLVSLYVKDRNDSLRDVVWGYESIEEYLQSTDKYCGPIVGRYGNRIGKGSFVLDGKSYQLSINENSNQLHGGENGFGTKVWTAKALTDSSLSLTYVSPDGEEGYPGELSITVDFTVTESNQLKIYYTATCADKATILNPTCHAYFNLHGTSDSSTNSHVLYINADKFTPTDSELIPTGDLQNVEGTPLDFRTPLAIGKRIDVSDFQPMVIAKGYDHNFVLNKDGSDNLQKAAEVYEASSGIVMSVITDQVGLQFYSGNFMDGKDTGKRGDKHNYRTGIALETQNFPDAPNKKNFPSAVLRPGETYHQTCIYSFSTK